MSAQIDSGSKQDLDRLRIPEGQRRRRTHRRRWPYVVLGMVVVITGLTIVMRPVDVKVASARVGGEVRLTRGAPF